MFVSADEVSNNPFDGSGMGLLRAVAEASDLVDSELDIGPGVGWDVLEHAYCSWVAPFFVERFPIGVGSKGSQAAGVGLVDA